MRPIRATFFPITATTLVLLTLCTPALVHGANPFAKVPFGHWAYHALDRMYELGITNSINKVAPHNYGQLTRVEIAIEVADVVNQLATISSRASGEPASRFIEQRPEDLVKSYNERVSVSKQLSANDEQLLLDLIAHFQFELEALGYRFGDIYTPNVVNIGSLARALGRLQLEIQANENERRTISGTVSPGQKTNYELSTNLALSAVSIDGEPHVAALVLNSTGRNDIDDTLPYVLTVQPEFSSHEQAVLYRFNELAGRSWPADALHQGGGLLGVQAGVKLGQLGSTILLAHHGAGEAGGYIAALDGAVHLDSFTLGATLIHSSATLLPWEAENQVQEGTLAGVQGSYRLSPGVVVTGGFAGSLWDDQEGQFVRLGGTMQLSDHMSLEAAYRLQGAGFRRVLVHPDLESESERDLQAFDLSLDMGDITWTAGKSVEDAEESIIARTSLGVYYPVGELTHFRFGYALIEERDDRGGNLMEFRTSETAVGVEHALPSGSISLRYKISDVVGDAGESSASQSKVETEFTLRF